METKRTGGGLWKAFGLGRKDAEDAKVGKPGATVAELQQQQRAPTAAKDERNEFSSDAPLGQVASDDKAPVSSAPVAGAQKPWQTRLDVKDKATSSAVAKAVLAVMSGLPPELLLEPVRSAALALTDGQKAGDAAAMQRVYQRCLRELDPTAVADALGHLALAVNDAAHAALTVDVAHKDEVPKGKGDSRDWHRTWGLRLLPDDDACFRDPKYLVALNQESKGVRATTHEGRTSLTSSRARFEEALAKLAPNTKLLAVTESGSDAVALCFQLATALGRRREWEPGRQPFKDDRNTPQLGFFDGVYGGSRGRGAGMNFAGWGKSTAERLDQWRLPSPTSFEREPKGPELERVKQVEREALSALEKQLQKYDMSPLGAIFLEPIQGANGVRFYRTEFLLEVRKLADQYGVPIVADEVLTCAGRTGKMFAYQHYKGFEPDFVLFGKGMQASGVLSVERKGQKPSQRPQEFDLGVTTAGGDATRFLKGAQVLDRIREGKLIENAAEVGAYLTQQLREVQQFHGVTADASGAGLLVGMHHVDGTKFEVSHSWGNTRDRYMPPLTLTKADVDAVIADLKKKLPDEKLVDLEARREQLLQWQSEISLLDRVTDGEKREMAALLAQDLKKVDADLAALRDARARAPRGTA